MIHVGFCVAVGGVNRGPFGSTGEDRRAVDVPV
jgi:hypothetical protein